MATVSQNREGVGYTGVDSKMVVVTPSVREVVSIDFERDENGEYSLAKGP